MIEFTYDVGDTVSVGKWKLETFGGTVIHPGESVVITARHGGEFDNHPRYNVSTLDGRKVNSVKEEDLCTLK